MSANLEAAVDEVEHELEVDREPTSWQQSRAPHAQSAAAASSIAGERPPLSDDEQRKRLPWHRRPSPLFLLPGVVCLALAMGATMPSKLELINLMCCRAYSPHYAPETSTMSNTSSWLPSWLREGRPLDSLACRHDARVQQIVANLILGLTLITGILSAFSTGFWLDLSDRYGRAKVCAVTLLAFALGDTLLLLGIYQVDHLTPYFILSSGLVEGFGGGLATLIATSNAYCADSTPTGSRSGTFSLVGGCLFAGFGLGPTFGGFVIRLFNGNPVAPYFFSMSAYLGCFVGLFVIPEALSLARRQEAARELAFQKSKGQKSFKSRFFSFLKPLRLLLPQKTSTPLLATAEGEQPEIKTDWTLTLIACAYAMQTGLYAVMSFKMLYSQYKFGWGPVEVGYLMSAAGGSRVLYLVVLLPLATRLFRRKHNHIALAGDEDTLSQLAGGQAPEEESEFSRIDKLNEEAAHIKQMHDSHFDLGLARVSLVIETLTFIAFSLNTGPVSFVICTLCQALGAGTAPALQSLALSRVSAKESGRVLAALSVCQTLTSQVIGPLAFGSLYASTIKTTPEAIFIAASVLVALATGFVSTVRLKARTSTID